MMIRKLLDDVSVMIPGCTPALYKDPECKTGLVLQVFDTTGIKRLVFVEDELNDYGTFLYEVRNILGAPMS